METIKSFKQLRIWQEGMALVKRVYALTMSLPKEELYGLTMQMRRAAVSIPVNIAEGFKRFHRKEYKQFLHIALGSAAELETELIIANHLAFITADELSHTTADIERLSKMISVLLSRLSPS